MNLSVVMSVYNETADMLKASIESIIKQSYDEFEYIIVVDNPLNKLLIDLVKDYAQQDSRISLLVNDYNLGLARSLNIAIEHATGIYIARMDADDISRINRFERQMNYLKNNPNVDILGSRVSVMNEEGEVLYNSPRLPSDNDYIKQVLEFKNVIYHSSVIMRKEAIEQLGGYRNFPIAQDLDLWLRAVANGCRFAIINESLLYYRHRNESVSLGSSAYKQEITIQYICDLEKERRKNGADSFSDEKYAEYIRMKCRSTKREMRFMHKKTEYKKGINLINNGRILEGGLKILVCCLSSSIIKRKCVANIRYWLFMHRHGISLSDRIFVDSVFPGKARSVI